MLAVQWYLEQTQWWPREALLERQFRQLRQVVSHAVEQVPWYRHALELAGLGGAADLTPQTFRRWPLLRKQDVRPNEAALQPRGYPPSHGRKLESWTTGSTGEPTRVFHTEVSQFFTHAMVLREHLWSGRDFSAKFGTIRTTAKRGSTRGWGLPNAIFSTGPGCSLNIAADLDEQLEWLVSEAPAYLLSHPSNLRALILRSRETGRVPPALKQLIAFGEMLPPDLRALAQRHWHVPVIESYSCEEFGPIAGQCPGHEHLLVHGESVYVEVLREDGTACEPGETGRIVVSSLQNFGMPLLRYELGDYAEVGGNCPSGRGLFVLRHIAGRSRNMLRDPSGRVRWPSFPADMWLAIAPFRRVRLVQEAPEEIEAQFVIDRELTPPEAERLVSALRERLGYPFRIRLARLASIPREPGGKYEDFVSRVQG